jgi:hypothetical protein
MTITWPSERMSGTGLGQFGVAAAALVLGVLSLRRWGLSYLAPMASNWTPLLVGFSALFACGFALFGIVRRREYPWIIGFAAVALPLFQPSLAPYRLTDRVVFGIRDLALIAVAVLFVARAIKSTDELERRVHLEALAWSYPVVLTALIAYAMAQDLLPPLRGPWVASAMLATWTAAWVFVSLRYQR